MSITNIFYFVKRWPRHNQSSQCQKTLSLIQSFCNIGHKVLLVSADTAPEESFKQISDYPIDLVHIAPNKVAFSLAQAKTKPDLAIFNSWQMEQYYSVYLYNKWNQCPRILEINRLDGLQLWRKQAYRDISKLYLNEQGKALYPEDFSCFLEEELRSIRRCDYYLCGNDFLFYLLTKKLKTKNASISSFGYPMIDFQNEASQLEYRPFKSRKNFVYVGNFIKEETLDDVAVLISQIWPRISKKIDCQLHIYGYGFNKQLQAQKKVLQKQGIKLMGTMEDLQHLDDYRVFLNPVCSSSSTKGKTIDSWFYHLPVVTTPIGAEGLFYETIEPKFSGTTSVVAKSGFTNERETTKEEQLNQKKLKKYYDNNVIDSSIAQLTFGGSFQAFSYDNFAQDAIKMYTDQKRWQTAVKVAEKSMLLHHGEGQMQDNLRYSISQVQLAVYEQRVAKEYEQEWKRYLKSKELHTRLNETRR